VSGTLGDSIGIPLRFVVSSDTKYVQRKDYGARR
jgi:hypothetical protein